MVLHDAHVRAFKCSERYRFACECRYVAWLEAVDELRYLKLVRDRRGVDAVALIERGVKVVRALNRGR